MQNETYEEFRERILGTEYMIWHEGGPDTSQLVGLRGEEKEYAFGMLLKGLEGGDYAAVQGLEALDPVAALPHIKKMVPGASAQLRLELIKFINAHDPVADRAALAEMVMSLVLTPATCLDATIVLRHFPTPEVKEFLLDALAKSPEYLIRYHAANSLLHMIGSSLDAHPEVFQNLSTGGDAVKSNDFPRFVQAADQIRLLMA